MCLTFMLPLQVFTLAEEKIPEYVVSQILSGYALYITILLISLIIIIIIKHLSLDDIRSKVVPVQKTFLLIIFDDKTQ